MSSAHNHQQKTPIERRACCVVGEILDREEMSQCTQRGQFMCAQHCFDCPIKGIRGIGSSLI